MVGEGGVLFEFVNVVKEVVELNFIGKICLGVGDVRGVGMKVFEVFGFGLGKR